MNSIGWQRCTPATGYRQICNALGEIVAECPSYGGGPTLAEAQVNAEVIATGTHLRDATPAPWSAVQGHGMWLVVGGPDGHIVAMVRQRADESSIAEQIAALAPAQPA